MLLLVLAVASLLAFLLFNAAAAAAARKQQKLPPGCKPIPGPSGLPLLGNLHQLPNDYPWRKFKEWLDIYGPVMEVKLGRESLIVLLNNETAKELLERRGQNYSSRPQTYMACKVLSGDLRPLLMPYGDRWRRARKFIHQMTMPAKALNYQPRQDRESRKLLYDLLQEPQDFACHYYRYASGLVMGLTYDMLVVTGKEEYVKSIVQVNDTLEHTAKPGAFLVDYLPVLELLPLFMAPFKRLGKAAHEFEYALFMKLLQDIEKKLSRGSSIGDCFAKEFLDKEEKKDLTDDEGAYACGTMFEAGSGTMSGALEILTMALLLFPEIQGEAQKELDAVCGDRLPQFEDEQNLPYVKAVAKEALRWCPIVAQGILHMSVKDDRYGDYFIPANTAILGNHWAIHMDPEMYPEPDRFNPRRFIDPSFPTAQTKDGVEYGASHGHWAFGFGRRACPGQHIGEFSLFILTARLLWAFNFKKYVTADGHVQEPDPLAFTTGFNSKPKEFPATIIPRSEARADVVREAYFSQWGKPDNKGEPVSRG